MKILILGKTGQIGRELLSLLDPHHTVTACGREDVDLAQPNQIRNAVRADPPALIINAAAYTAVDRAETEPELAHQLNGVAPGVLAEEALQAGALLIHYSTDYVFDGEQATPYLETDLTQPLGVYGKTKWEGERRIQESGCLHLILRTSSVYGMRGNNFFRTISRLAREKSELTIVNDQIMTPNWCRTLARATQEVIDRLFREQASLNREIEARSGVYHLTCSGQASWFDFARRIVRALDLAAPPRLVPVSSAEYSSNTPRPNHSVLDGQKIKQVFDVALPSWEDDFEQFLKTGLP